MRLIRIGTAAALVLAGMGAPAGPTAPDEAAAHCSGSEKRYAAGYLSGPTSIGVKSKIQWHDAPESKLCNSGVSHSVTVCKTGSCPKWSQVGWRNYHWYTVPKGYCEWGGQQYRAYNFSIGSSAHTYKISYDSRDKYWDCYLNGSAKTSWSLANSGFSEGTYHPAQGEAHKTHVRIGKKHPSKLLFSEMKYKKKSSGSWLTMNVTLHSVQWPHGRDEPAAGKMRVWTYDH